MLYKYNSRQRFLLCGIIRANTESLCDDLLGQTHSLFCWIWKVETDGRTTCAKTTITTGGDCGLVSGSKLEAYVMTIPPSSTTSKNLKTMTLAQMRCAHLRTTFSILV